eukprot:g73929.t1
MADKIHTMVSLLRELIAEVETLPTVKVETLPTVKVETLPTVEVETLPTGEEQLSAEGRALASFEKLNRFYHSTNGPKVNYQLLYEIFAHNALFYSNVSDLPLVGVDQIRRAFELTFAQSITKVKLRTHRWKFHPARNEMVIDRSFSAELLDQGKHTGKTFTNQDKLTLKFNYEGQVISHHNVVDQGACRDKHQDKALVVDSVAFHFAAAFLTVLSLETSAPRLCATCTLCVIHRDCSKK